MSASGLEAKPIVTVSWVDKLSAHGVWVTLGPLVTLGPAGASPSTPCQEGQEQNRGHSCCRQPWGSGSEVCLPVPRCNSEQLQAFWLQQDLEQVCRGAQWPLLSGPTSPCPDHRGVQSSWGKTFTAVAQGPPSLSPRIPSESSQLQALEHGRVSGLWASIPG